MKYVKKQRGLWNRAFTVALGSALLLAICIPEALADSKNVPGSMCEARSGSQVGDFTKRYGRQTNTSASTRKVICPILRDNLGAVNNTSVDVYVYDGTTSGYIRCKLAERLLGAEAGLQWTPWVYTSELEARHYRLDLDLRLVNLASKLYFECDLPEDSYIGGYRWNE